MELTLDVFYSDHSCADISAHIVNAMGEKFLTEIESEKLKIGIMIDKSLLKKGKKNSFSYLHQSTASRSRCSHK